MDLRDFAAHVEPGMRLALPVDYAGVSMAMTRALIDHGAGGLELFCVPTGGLQVDQLIGAGLVRVVETSAVSLGEVGGAPRFNQAVKDGTITIKDATCPAIHASLLAAQKGNPFQPLRGLIGTDILRFRTDWRVIGNPFADSGDPIVLIPAVKPRPCDLPCPDGGSRRERVDRAATGARFYGLCIRCDAGHRGAHRPEESLLKTEASAAGTLPSPFM